MKRLRVGQKVQIEFETLNSEKIQVICNIKEIYEDRLTLSYPKELVDFFEFLSEGTEIKAYIFTEANIQVVDSIILNAPYENEFEIEYSGDYRSIQRRAYIRENIECEFILKNKETTLKGKTKDIGGGGARLLIKENPPVGSYMEIWIDIQDNQPSVKAVGKISQKAYYTKNEYLIEFSEISENDRNRIIKKCITEQVNQLRK